MGFLLRLYGYPRISFFIGTGTKRHLYLSIGTLCTLSLAGMNPKIRQLLLGHITTNLWVYIGKRSGATPNTERP